MASPRVSAAAPGCLRRVADALRKAPLLVAALAGVVGIACVDAGHLLAGALLAGLLLAGAVIGRPRHRPLAAITAAAAVSLTSLGWRHHERLTAIRSFPLASALAEGQSLEIAGEGWIADRVESGERAAHTTIRLRTVTVGGREWPCDHLVPAWMQRPPPGLGYGQALRFTGRLLPLEGPEVPGGFDARSFHFRQSGSLGRLEIRSGDSCVLQPGRRGSGLVRFAQLLRARFEEVLRIGVPPSLEPHARLIAAMTLGAREHTPEELEDFFRISGTMHLFAVSGLHVGIVAGLLVGLAAFLGMTKARAVPFVIPLILFYAVLTGLSPSAVRAAVMASVFLAGYAIREKPRLLNSLGAAALLLLAVDPQQLFLPGFQLSFLVLLFIALFAPPLRAALARPLLADPFLPRSLVPRARRVADRCVQVLAASQAVSLASWMGSAGLLAWHFQSVSPVAVVANVVMVPFASVIISLAAASIVSAGLPLTWLTLALNRVNLGCTVLLTALAQCFASIPGAMVHTGGATERPPTPGTLRVHVVGDRGDGAALLELRPPGSAGSELRWMIDAGGSRTYRGSVLPLLRSRGVNRLDALVLTHGDEGHIGAAPAVLGQFRPSLLFESSAENRSPVHPEILAAVDAFGVTRIEMDRGHLLRLGPDTVLTVLHPSSLRPGRLADDRALVLRLVHAGRTLLFTSDGGFDTENALLEGGADLRAEVWIRGQHRDSPPGLPAFVDAIRPRAVVSTHADFPESERIPPALRELLHRRGIPLYDLAAAGSVAIEIGAEAIRIAPHAGNAEPLRLPARVGGAAGRPGGGPAGDLGNR